MVIKIDPHKEARLQEIAKETGRTLDQVVQAAIDREIREQPQSPSDGMMTEEKHAAMMARIDEIRSMPRKSPEDGFTPEDHDKVIYRIDE